MGLDKFLTKVVTGSGVTLLSMMVIKAMTLLNSVIAARLLSPADFGALSIIINLQNLIVMIACFGIPLAMAKHVSQYQSERKEMANAVGSTLLGILLITSILTSICYLLLAEVISVNLYNDEGLINVIRLSAVFVFISTMNLGLSSLVQGCQRISALAKINAAIAIFAQPIAFVFISALGLDGAIVALVITNILSATLMFSVARRCLSISLRNAKKMLFQDSRQVRALLDFSIPAFFAGIIIIVASWVGRTVLALEWDFGTVGQFQIADSLSQILLIISAAMSIPLLPLISEQSQREPDSVGEDSRGLLSITMFLALPLSLMILPFLAIGIDLLYGAAYSGAVAATVLMFAAATFRIIGAVISNVILGTGRVWDALKLNLVWLAAFLVLLFVMVDSLGAEGLAGTYAIVFLLYLWILLAYFRSRYDVSVLRIGLVSTLYFPFVLFYADRLVGEEFLLQLAFVSAAALLFLLMGVKLVLRESERNQMRSIIAKGLRFIGLS
jgi:O-antigen/teichoic acid export membrane protein